MFYTATACPFCDEVDISPDYDQEMTENKYEIRECFRCSYEGSVIHTYSQLLSQGDHCSHVEEHLFSDIPF